MSSAQDSIQLKLTPEQQKQVLDATGKLADTLEFDIMELEERIAPMKTVRKGGQVISQGSRRDREAFRFGGIEAPQGESHCSASA